MTTKEPIRTKLNPIVVSFGCDPEFFFEKEGKIIGSEKIIDIEKGLLSKNPYDNKHSKFIVDGVQAELNPLPNTCRANLGNEISKCFQTLYNQISKDEKLKAVFNTTIKITEEELKTLDKKSRVFGCAPSKNTDKNAKSAVNMKDPSKYLYRSAGGHIHLAPSAGHQSTDKVSIIMKDPDRLIQVMDIIVGNTCVLMDRDPGNKERRKVYGRAGEYRTPPHGVEYRTLSNFWLKAYPLMSLVMNLSRLSVNILTDTMPGRDYEQELLSLVDMKKIKKAINNNDFKLAWHNFQQIKPFLARITTEHDNFPLHAGSIPAFEYFISKGLDNWFTEDPIQHWIKIPEGHTSGWENFLKNIVAPKMSEDTTTPAPNIK